MTEHAKLAKPGSQPRLAGAPGRGNAAPVLGDPGVGSGLRDDRPERRSPHEDVGAVLDG